MSEEEANQDVPAGLGVSPGGHVYFYRDTEACEQLPAAGCTQIGNLFAEGGARSLLHLGLCDFESPLPPSFLFWQTFSRQFILRVCRLQNIENRGRITVDVPGSQELQALVDQAPFMKGVEYLTEERLGLIWQEMEEVLEQELRSFAGSVQEYLGQYGPRWNQVGRVCFHLAENKNSEQKPFAFMATYTTPGSQGTLPQHLPLRRALQESAMEKGSSALLSLLIPVQKAALVSPFIRRLVDAGTVFEAVAWTAHEAHQFLQSIPSMEASGVMVRVPNWWSAKRPPRLKTEVHLGGRPDSVLGLDSLLEFDVRLAYGEDRSLTKEEWLELQKGEGSLVKIRGEWVEVDREKLNTLLSHWDHLKKASRGGLSMAEGLRLLAGVGSMASQGGDDGERGAADWFQVTAGSWLATVLEKLKRPENCLEKEVEEALHWSLCATLRPYQRKGVHWLWMLYQLRLGGCLADDMGLGKTIQILSLLLVIKAVRPPGKPHLLVLPASLLGNWQAEAARFAPSLKISAAHKLMDQHRVFFARSCRRGPSPDFQRRDSTSGRSG